MEYGALVREAFRITLRHRSLWVFGFFAGGGSCGVTGSNVQAPIGNSGDMADLLPDLERAADAVGAWMAANVGLVVLASLLVFALIVAFGVLSVIAQGALLGAVGRISSGEPMTLRAAWAIGRRVGWRFVRLWLLGFAIVMTTVLVAAVAGVGVVAAAGGGTAAIVLGVLLALVAIVVGVPFFLAAAVSITYAERAIALDNMGARESLARGIALLRTRLGQSIVLWLISIGINIGTGIVLVLAALILIVPLGLVVAAAYAIDGFGAGTIALGVVAAVVFVVAFAVTMSACNTFSATYWTLAYLGLTGRQPGSGGPVGLPLESRPAL